MEVTDLVPAVVTGLVIGALGWFVLPDGRGRPVWPAIVTGVVAAVIGTLVARALGVAGNPGVNWLELSFQLTFAAAGVAGLAGVTSTPSTTDRHRRTP